MRRMCTGLLPLGRSTRAIVSQVLTVALTLGAPAFGHAQSAPDPPAPWAFTISVGGYAPGNRTAVSSWLSANGYGVPEPPQCGFDALLRQVCDPGTRYPKVSRADIVGWMFSIRRRVGERASVEVFGATEQSGSVTGRCDDSAVPRDARCTSRFVTVDFGGASLAALASVRARAFHFGAGPALLLANWEMQPAHLAGMWLDARFGGDRVPMFARAQLRIYQSVSFSPSERFTSFHPATLYLGGGITVHLDDSSR